ncbi:TonB-dependent receptor family protein [Nitrosomonas halophila]|uniref:Iron complex outermembrane recepter protein n=1 Tax=Nitrosomonas halophila TaxID=44576 RepID=A0A1H3JLR6_9PROT|nr:TonB-dependent receptor [Nitrosomonas halophila]SDY40882.1 iron complex outermembrane recepter protein [Nitrosomonas halophila]
MWWGLKRSEVRRVWQIGSWLPATLAWAQPPADTAPIMLDPIQVTATRSPRQLSQIPGAISLISRAQQHDYLPGRTLDEFGRGTPGVFFQNQFNFAQDLRIAIRGFGARSAFGVRGIQMHVDGVPLTLPDGQTQLDGIDPSLIERMEILRGPSAALFGNASGGMISMTTRTPPHAGWVIAPRQVFGQFGQFKSEIYTGGRSQLLDYGWFGSYLRQRGWRDHSETENLFSQLKLNYLSGDDADWMLVFRKFYSPETLDPGGLTLAELRADRRQASPGNLRFNAGERIDQEQFALRYRKAISAARELTVTVHGLHRDFRNRLPFVAGGQVSFARWVGGVSLQYVSDHTLLQRPNRFLAGFDYGIQNDDRQRYHNDFGARGALALNQIERVQSIGPFFRNEWEVSDRLAVTLGGRWDWLHYQVKDKFRADGDQSGSRILSQASGTVGFVYRLADRHQFYANAASVFEAPTTTELINNPAGAGGFNPDLDAQLSLSRELGVRGELAGLGYEATGFLISSRDEILPFELAAFPGRAFFRNVGRSRRLGFEGSLSTPVWKGWRAQVAYSYSDFTFQRFDSDANNLQGNALPGIPAHRWDGNIRYTHPSGLFGQLYLQRVGGFFADNANTVTNPAYLLGQLLFGWEIKHNDIEGSLFAGIDNLFDARYNANVRINAAAGRYFEPGPPRNVFGGIRVRLLVF